MWNINSHKVSFFLKNNISNIEGVELTIPKVQNNISETLTTDTKNRTSSKNIVFKINLILYLYLFNYEIFCLDVVQVFFSKHCKCGYYYKLNKLLWVTLHDIYIIWNFLIQ